MLETAAIWVHVLCINIGVLYHTAELPDPRAQITHLNQMIDERKCVYTKERIPTRLVAIYGRLIDGPSGKHFTVVEVESPTGFRGFIITDVSREELNTLLPEEPGA